MDDQRVDPYLYAQHYSQMPLNGVHFLAFRDIPNLIKRFVNGKKTLDYGCGHGRSCRFLKSLGLEVDGVDINEHMIRLSRELEPNGNYVVINSGEIPTDNDYYDLVYAGMVLPYVSSKQELLKILRDIARVLKTDGTFIALVANKDFYKYEWLEEDTNYDMNKHLESGSVAIVRVRQSGLTLYHYYWSEDDYLEALRMSGLALMETHKQLGTDLEGFAWVNERTVSALTLYVAKKM